MFARGMCISTLWSFQNQCRFSLVQGSIFMIRKVSVFTGGELPKIGGSDTFSKIKKRVTYIF